MCPPVNGWGLEYLHRYYPKRVRLMDWFVEWVIVLDISP